MLKGKLGITLSAVAALSFVFAYFGAWSVLVLVVAYALIVEGNNWLTKQTLQALFLSLALSITKEILGFIFGGAIYFLRLVNLNGAIGFVAGVQNVCGGLVTLGMLAVCIAAIFKVMKDNDADLPFIGAFADSSLGVMKQKAAPQPQYKQPVAPIKATAPVQTYAPVHPTPVHPTPVHPTPVQPVPILPIAPASWVCTCGKSNTGKFCSICGNKNSND